MDFKTLFAIKGASQDFIEAPQLIKVKRNIILLHDYETESGVYEWTGLTFKDVISYKVSSEACIKNYILGTLDTLVELRNSTWLEEVKSVYRGNEVFDSKHYLIFFEDYGLYEFIAGEALNNVEEVEYLPPHQAKP